MSRPIVSVSFGYHSKQILNEDIYVQNTRERLGIRQLVVEVNTSRQLLKNGAVEAGMVDRGFWRSVLDIVRNREPIIAEAAWGRNTTGIVIPDETIREHFPQAIAASSFQNHRYTLDPTIRHFATLLFTLEGEANAYLTNEHLYPIPIAKKYTLFVYVVGHNLANAPVKVFRVDLRAWNDIRVYELSITGMLSTGLARFVNWYRRNM